MNDKDLARFMSKVEIREGSDCWYWIGTAQKKGGYGTFQLGVKNLIARRVIYEHAEGAIPEKHVLKVSCGSVECVNPSHAVPSRYCPSVLQKRRTREANKGNAYNRKPHRVIDGIETKRCSKCGKWTEVSGFYKRSNARDGLESHCKRCKSISIEVSHSTYPERKLKKQNYRKEWRILNKSRDRATYSRYHKRRSIDDPSFRISNSIRGRICHSIKEQKSGREWQTLVGYSLESLVRHIEKGFVEGMSWENYGLWHIDHRRPIVSFDFTSPEDPGFKECWSLSNLQPLWAKDNCSKGARYEN